MEYNVRPFICRSRIVLEISKKFINLRGFTLDFIWGKKNGKLPQNSFPFSCPKGLCHFPVVDHGDFLHQLFYHLHDLFDLLGHIAGIVNLIAWWTIRLTLGIASCF